MKPHGYYDLVESFAGSGCALCDQVLRSAARFLDYFLNDRLLEQATYDKFRARRGLCNTHTWQVMELMGSSTSLAILYNVAMDEVLTQLEKAAAPTTSKRGFGGLLSSKTGASPVDSLEPTGQCVACTAMQEAEAHYVKILSQHATDQRMRDAYEHSAGLCVPHLRLVLRAVDRPEHAEVFISTQRAIWTRLKAELEEFIAKMDYRRADEVMGSEGDSWRRAAQITGGTRAAFGSDPRSP